jgi:hypothetical protein
MFPIRNGLKQGDTLSPLLFNFALEYAINTRSAGGASLPESTNSGQIDRRVLSPFNLYHAKHGR